MAAIKELQVYLKKIDYLGYGQRSSNIGDDLVFEFTRRGRTKKVKPDDLEHGESENFSTPLMYRRLKAVDFPYHIDIRTVASEVDTFIGDITDDINVYPVATDNFIVNKTDTEVHFRVEIEVHEDSNPQNHMAVFACHFKAVLRDLEQSEEEVEEEAEGIYPMRNPTSQMNPQGVL